MRVALACPYAWDAPGGVQIHVRQLAEQLRARGHRTLILAPAWTDPDEAGVVVAGSPVRLRFNGSVAPIAPNPWALRRIRAVLEDFQPDVVHVHEPYAPSTGMYAAMAARAPVVGTFHAYAERSVAMAVFAPLLRIVRNRVGVRLAVSAAAASFAGRHVEGGFRIVPNGVDVERFARAAPIEGLEAGERLLFVGRLERRKGFRYAVRAFGLLANDLPRATLLVAGVGPEARAVDELPPPVRARVRMLGAVPYADLPRYHAAATAFVAPNTGGESFGIVLVEAMAAGLPVVASDIAGYRDVVRDATEGLLAAPRDPVALADALRRVLTDRDLARRLGEAGRARAARFSWTVVTGEVEQAYGDALTRAGDGKAR